MRGEMGGKWYRGERGLLKIARHLVWLYVTTLISMVTIM